MRRPQESYSGWSSRSLIRRRLAESSPSARCAKNLCSEGFTFAPRNLSFRREDPVREKHLLLAQCSARSSTESICQPSCPSGPARPRTTLTGKRGRSCRADLRVGSAGSADASSIRGDARHAPGSIVERSVIVRGVRPPPCARLRLPRPAHFQIFQNIKNGAWWISASVGGCRCGCHPALPWQWMGSAMAVVVLGSTREGRSVRRQPRRQLLEPLERFDAVSASATAGGNNSTTSPSSRNVTVEWPSWSVAPRLTTT